jgi:hypothetical protein
MTISRKLARSLCALALSMAPVTRRPLAQGMRVELEHVADGDALGFALGCLWSAAGWQLTSGEGVTRSARFLIAVGSGGFALACLVVALRLREDPSAVWSLGAIGLFYAGAALVSWRHGLGALALYAVAGLVLNTVAFLAQRELAPSPTAAYLSALVVEEFGLLALMLGMSLGARHLGARLER